jgi:hypothetical protein
MPTRISCGGTVLRFLFDSNSPSCSLSTLNRSTDSQEIKEGEFPLALLPFIFLPAAGMTPSPPPNVSSSSPSFFRSRLILARRSLCSDLAPFLAADLWEHRPRHGGSGARPHRRQHAAAGSRRCSRRLEANPAELLRHQLRLTILSKTPQESLRTVQRGGRSTTVFSNSDLAPPSSISIQPVSHLSISCSSSNLRWCSTSCM